VLTMEHDSTAAETGPTSSQNAVRIRTEAENLLGSSDSEFARSDATLAGLTALGTKAFNPEEVERNVVDQLEAQLDEIERVRRKGKTMRPRPFEDLLKESGIAEFISERDSDKSISIENVRRMAVNLERTLKRHRPTPNEDTASEFPRSMQLKLKLRFMREALRAEEQKIEKRREREKIQERAAARERARQDAQRRIRDQEEKRELDTFHHGTKNGSDLKVSSGIESKKRKRVAAQLSNGSNAGLLLLEPDRKLIKVIENKQESGKAKKKFMKDKKKEKKRGNSKESVQCPICGSVFTSEQIEVHASRCSTRSSASKSRGLLAHTETNGVNEEEESSSMSPGESFQESESGSDELELEVNSIDKEMKKQVKPVGRVSRSRFVEDDLDENKFKKRVKRADALDLIWACHWEIAIRDGKSEEHADAFAQEIEDSGRYEAVDFNPAHAYHTFDGGLKLSRRNYSKLFDYQRDAVKWMWELHRRSTGGILGDEMGLGKTVQVGSFLGALTQAEVLGPSIVACPATTISQWVQELNFWAPRARIYVFHSSGQGLGERKLTRRQLIDVATRKRGILITTYEGLRLSSEELLRRRWGYVILDEGHKIRNPDAEITMVCKQFQTHHRIVMTGSPIQNNLRELWTLVDFVTPGLLGTLPTFEKEFAIPINQGGYASASPAQVRTAYECAKVLKKTIDPYLIRRLKRDVAHSLPEKQEQVIFCNLTRVQVDAYKEFLRRPEVEELIANARSGGTRRTTFKLIRALQHICNHPDIYFEKQRESKDSIFNQDDVDFENDFAPDEATWIANNPLNRIVSRSGKMLVLRIILQNWKEQGHRVLLFSQGRYMLNILQRFLEFEGYNFLRMDGKTPIKSRSQLIEHFNNPTSDVFVFLLTTKVGGLGINLTGANRVLIFDPDWNPSTDMQARERAWRIGQKRQVTIYRLITSGTIEEKIYHRQIFKQYLSNKILTDARQRRFSKISDMRDLFTLGTTGDDHLSDSEVHADTVRNELAAKIKKRKKEKRAAAKSELTEAEKLESEKAAKRAVHQAHTETSDFFDDTEQQPRESSEGNILQSLFDQHGFRQVFSHDFVEEAAQSSPDQRILAEEAAKIARRAAEALRREQEMTRRNESNVHIPTWTGQLGETGRLGGAASSQLLEGLRQQGSSSAADESHIQELLRNSSDPSMRLVKDIHDFLKSSHKGRTTASLLERFHDRAQTIEPELFRRMLRELANLKGGRWKLKRVYQ